MCTNPAPPLSNPVPTLIPTNIATVRDATRWVDGTTEGDRRAALLVEGVPVAAFGGAADHAVAVSELYRFGCLGNNPKESSKL